MRSFSCLILAAGRGIRMKSALPKVLHPVGGVPMAERVLRAVVRSKASSVTLVVGHQSDRVSDHLKAIFPRLRFTKQKTLDGSGGAVRAALAWVRKTKGDLLLTCGDMPLLREETFRRLIAAHRAQGNDATVLSAVVPDPTGYGRIVRGGNDEVFRIVEELDASPRERGLHEINTGTYVFKAAVLARLIPKLKNNNAKREYYLTDVLQLIRESGGRAGASILADYREAQGINNRMDLAKAQAVVFERKAEELMREGVTIIDPRSTYIEDGVTVGPDTVIWPQTILLGRTQIGSGCRIGPWTQIRESKIENDATIQASYVDEATIQKGAKVGPFSRVRPKSVVGPGAHLGNFSEIKNARLGAGSKVNHLSYMGDATLGKNVNIGAGTITCNYDGFQKHPTVIKDHAFIGSNTNLIAPITVGDHSVVGAGSSLSANVPAWSLALERAPVKVKKGWAKKSRKK